MSHASDMAQGNLPMPAALSIAKLRGRGTRLKSLLVHQSTSVSDPALRSFCYTPVMHEVITILEAEVAQEKWKSLKDTYFKEATVIPESIKQTFLVQSQSQPDTWSIITHWRSQEDLDHMRAAEAVPVAVRIFRAVGAVPHLEIWDAVVHHRGPAL